MPINWDSKDTRYLKFTLQVLIENIDNSKSEREKNKRGKSINEITRILRLRGEKI